jgi:hypothetical protein
MGYESHPRGTQRLAGDLQYLQPRKQTLKKNGPNKTKRHEPSPAAIGGKEVGEPHDAEKNVGTLLPRGGKNFDEDDNGRESNYLSKG